MAGRTTRIADDVDRADRLGAPRGQGRCRGAASDGTAPLAIHTFNRITGGGAIFPRQAAIANDHFVFTGKAEDARQTSIGLAFADRHGLEGRTFQPASPGVPSSRARGFIDDAVDALRRADDTLSGLQDSMLPVEVGDAELRAGLADVREQIGGLAGRARELIRTLGR